MKYSGPAAVQGFLNAYMMGMQMNEQRRARQEEMAYNRERARVSDLHSERLLKLKEEDSAFSRAQSEKLFKAQEDHYADEMNQKRLEWRQRNEQFNATLQAAAEDRADTAMFRNRQMANAENQTRIEQEKLVQTQYAKNIEAYTDRISQLAYGVQENRIKQEDAIQDYQAMINSASSREEAMEIAKLVGKTANNPSIFKRGKGQDFYTFTIPFALDYKEEGRLAEIPTPEGHATAVDSYARDKTALELKRIDIMKNETLDPLDKRKALLELDAEHKRLIRNYRKLISENASQPAAKKEGAEESQEQPTGVISKLLGASEDAAPKKDTGYRSVARRWYRN